MFSIVSLEYFCEVKVLLPKISPLLQKLVLPGRNAAIESVISLSLRFFRERKKWLLPDFTSTKFKVSSIFNIPKKYKKIQETKKKKPQLNRRSAKFQGFKYLHFQQKKQEYRKHREEAQPDSRSIRSRPLGPQRWEDGGSPWAVGHNHQVLTRTRAHLFCDITEPFVLPDALEGLSKERVERFVACSRVARPISGDREGCHPPEEAFSLCSQ